MEAVLEGECPDLPGNLLEHLETCAVCRQRWEAAVTLRDALTAWPEPEPAVAPSEIAQRVLADRRERQCQHMRWMLAVCLVLGLGLVWGMGSLPEPVLESSIGRVASREPFDRAPARLPQLTQTVNENAQRTQLADNSLGIEPLEGGRIALQDIAYFLLPDEVRRSVENVVETVAPGPTASPEFGGVTALTDWLSLSYLPVEQLWEPVKGLGQSSLRLFRDLIPQLDNQPNS